LGRGDEGSSGVGDEGGSTAGSVDSGAVSNLLCESFCDWAVLTPGGKPDWRRLEVDVPAFSYDAGDVLPLAGGVLDLFGHYRKEFTIL